MHNHCVKISYTSKNTYSGDAFFLRNKIVYCDIVVKGNLQMSIINRILLYFINRMNAKGERKTENTKSKQIEVH